MTIFISYSRRDREWVDQLIASLQELSQGDPIEIWEDSRIEIAGGDWRTQIDQALYSAQLAVLVLSPDFITSEFITQFEDPLIRLARRSHLRVTWVHLRSCQYPTSPFHWIDECPACHDIGQPLDAIEDPTERARVTHQIATKIWQTNNAPSPSISDNELRSERGVDYRHLRFLLEESRWKEADFETGTVLMKVAGRQSKNYVLCDDEIKSLPCLDLETIDKLWRNYSRGRFGFTVQKELYERTGNRGDGRSEGEQAEENFIEFGKLVGWRKHNKWIRYSDLDFGITAPQGHLPVTPLYRSTIVGAMSYMIPLLDPMLEAVGTLLFSSEEQWPDLGNEWGLWWRLLYAQIDRCEASGFFVPR